MSSNFAADWILFGAAIHEPTGERLAAEALAVGQGRICFVGSARDGAQWIGPETHTIRGSGLHVYPGLADAHGHLTTLGQRLDEIDLGGARSLEEALERVRRGACNLPPDAWVLGGGWDESSWPGARLPTASDLDRAAGGRPAYLARKDLHSAWVSSRALSLAHITPASPDPDGGKILREVSGRPLGILVEHATQLVRRLIHAAGEETILRRIQAAEGALLAAGLTSVHEMGVDAEALAAFRRLNDERRLRLRVYTALRDDSDLWDRELDRRPERPNPDDRLTVRSVKLFVDGSLGSKSAAMLEDYSGDPGNRGLLLLSPEELHHKLTRAIQAGFQACVHAIGDRANRVVLEALERALGENQSSGRDGARPRIEHAQVVHSDDVSRFATLGVVASMQPVHCASDMGLATDRLGSERSRRAYAWGSLARAGVPLAFGSDLPVESYDPRQGLFTAITRQTRDGFPLGGWTPEERLTFSQALDAYTRGAAFAAFAETERGCILPGMRADLTIFDRDLSAGDPSRILTARVAATIVEGRVEYADDPSRWPR